MQSKQASAIGSPRSRRLIVVCGGSALLCATLASAAHEPRDKESALLAPVSGVTVYSDRARVVRSARLELTEDGPRRFVLPLLSTHIDASSIRIDARPAAGQGDIDVDRVEIARVEGAELPVSETQRLLDGVEALDDQLNRLGEERGAYQSQLELLGRLTPAAPLVPSLLTGGKPALLNPVGWTSVLGFVRGAMEKLHGSMADNLEKTRQVTRKRDQMMSELRLLGGAQQRSAYRVTATLHGHGAALLWLSYVTPSARWLPAYDIQLVPGRNQVELSFSGQVSQETGEDWTDVALMLSTAVPAAATQAPKLTTWKLGSRERFIPTPPPVSERRPPPPPPLSPNSQASPTELLRRRLLLRAGLDAGNREDRGEATVDRDADGIADSIDARFGDKDKKKEADRPLMKTAEDRPMGGMIAPEALPPPPSPPKPVQVYSRETVVDVLAAAPAVHAQSVSSYDMAGESFNGVTEEMASRRAQVLGVGLAPPPGYRAPPLAGNSPAALAGGYDLNYPSLYRETVASGKGARRVALFSRSFPVSVQRKVFAALSKDAYLVAEINNPSQQPLPGGQAQLFVGADPAGVATLHLVAPGEAFTLPLGLDRALKPVRNVRLSTVEKGVFSKDEITEYVVTTELSNPYRQPIDVRILDQLPFAGDKNVDVQLLRSEPPATPDRDTGALTWRLTVPAGGKIETRFVYTLRRPKGARLYQ